MRASDYRRTAREALRGKWGQLMPVVLLLLFAANDFGLNTVYQLFFSEERFIMLFGDVQYRYLAPVGMGFALLGVIYALHLFCLMINVGQYRVGGAVYAGDRPAAGHLFPMKLFWKVLAMSIVRDLLVGLQLLLFVVPGIVAAFRYSMADYLLAENPELGPIEALRESRARMMGRKAGLFCLQCSFLGWAFLYALVRELLVYLLPVTPAGEFAFLALALLLMTPLRSYLLMSEIAFFRNVYCGADAAERPEERGGMTQEEYDAAPIEDPEAVYTALSADETVAKDIFLSHGCSRARMREAGILEEYEKLKVSSSSEMAWVRDYGDELMRRFDRDPDALDELLSLAAENGSPELIDRTLQRIDRHIRQETLPNAEILDMAGRALAMLSSGAFDGSGGFVGRKRAQVSDMADRLEHRLSEEQPDGDWRRTLELIRSMCGEV